MISRALFGNIIKCPRNFTINSCSFGTAIDIEKLEKDTLEVEVDTEEARLREEEIERKRNKSRLYSYHQNTVNGRVPHSKPLMWQHETLKYKRKMYGKYGNDSGMNPSMCWPTDDEIAQAKYYESIAFPYNILQVREEALQKRAEEKEIIRKRQEEMVSKVAKLGQWTEDLKIRVAKKEAVAKAAKERRDRLVEEVRRHFGYKVDPKEDKFKELLEKKEKAERKVLKEARKKAKEEKLISSFEKGKEGETKEAVDVKSE